MLRRDYFQIVLSEINLAVNSQ